MKGWLWGVLLLVSALGLTAPAEAATVSGRAGSVLEWYDSADEETALPFYQYLQFNAKDLGTKGRHFRLYGRVADDLNNEEDVDSRLYYAYLEQKNLLDRLDFRLGRQFISTTAGASLMDGLSLDYRLAEDYRFKLFGGGDVAYYEGYNVKDLIAGIEIAGQFFDSLDLAGSYLQKWEGGLLGQELLGFDAGFDLDGKLHLYNELQWDLLSNRFSYVQLGGKYLFEAPLTLRLEYLYSLPVFSATSIYSVFAVSEYEEALAELTWRLRPGWQLFGRYVREIYPDFADADVFEAGLEKLRRGKYSGYLAGTYRSDADGQDLKGFKARFACRFTKKIEAGVGMHLDVMERQIAYFDTDVTSDQTTSRRYWADLALQITDKVNLEGKVERVDSDLWDYYNRGTVRLNLLF